MAFWLLNLDSAETADEREGPLMKDNAHAGSPSYTHLLGEPNSQPKIATIL
jgi:hypothetical protein